MNRKVKITIALFLLAAMMLSSIPVSAAEDGDGIRIAIVYSTGGKGDQSFNDAADRGRQQALESYPKLTIDEAEPTTVDEINTAIENYATAQDPYDLIIAIGFSSSDGVNASATNHPNQHFMIIDSVVDLPNVASVTFKEHEGSFLAGAMAAMTTQTNNIAFLGGLDIPLINKFMYGYKQGAMYINPDITVQVAYSPNPDNPWGDLAGGQTVAETFIENGADIIYAAAGGTGIGVMQAINKTENLGKYYAIGVDSDQDHLAPGFVLTSMIKRVDTAVFTEIKAVVEGTWAPGSVELGLAEDGVGISEMKYTQKEANTVYAGGKTRIEIVNQIKQDIIDGKIVVSSDSAPEPSITYEAKTPVSPFVFIGIFVAAIVDYRRRRN